MTMQEWLLQIEKDIQMLRLVRDVLNDFLYSLPGTGYPKDDCCSPCDDNSSNPMEELSEIIMLRLDILKQVLPRLGSAIDDFSSLMAGSVPKGEEG